MERCDQSTTYATVYYLYRVLVPVKNSSNTVCLLLYPIFISDGLGLLL